MLVNDGLIEKMFIEPQEPGDPFMVSDADTMLNHINPKATPRRVSPSSASLAASWRSGWPSKLTHLTSRLP